MNPGDKIQDACGIRGSPPSRSVWQITSFAFGLRRSVDRRASMSIGHCPTHASTSFL